MGKEQAKISALDILDLSGGLNSNQLTTKIEDNEFQDCKNIIWRDSAIYKTPGFQLLSSYIGGVGSTKKITGIYDYQKRDGTQYLIVTSEDDIIDFTTSPGTSIKGALTVNNALHQFITFNDRLVGTNFTDAPWTWNGAGNAVTLASLCGADLPPANAKYITVFNSRAVMGNYIDNGGNSRPTSVAFSGLDDVLDWDLTEQTWEFETDDSQYITGVRQLKDKLVVYKNNSIGLVSGYGTQSWTVQRDYIKGTGCVSGYSVKTGFLAYGGTLREVHIFLSQEGFKAFDGVNVYHLPIPKDGDDYKCFEYFDSLNKSSFNVACGEFYRKRNWYFCFYANSGSSVNDRGSIYNYTNNSLWPLHINATCVSTKFNRQSGEIDLLIGTEDGRILLMSEFDESLDGNIELTIDGNMEAAGVANYTVGTGTITKIGTDYFNGAQCLEFATTALDDTIKQSITTVVGSRYRAYVEVKKSVGAAGSQIKFYASNSSGAELDSSTISSPASWTRISVEFTATSTTTYLVIQNKTVATQTILIDDLSCRNCDLDSYGVTKDYDFGSEQDVKLLRELVPFANKQGNYNVQFTVTFDKGISSSTDNLNLLAGTATWGSFLWGSIVWGGKEEIQDDLENLTQDMFRTMRIKFSNPYGGQPFNINKMLVSALPIGRRFYHN